MYSFTSRVRYSEVDERGVLTPVALMNYLQDCSLFQTESLGFGPAHAEEVGLRWLLSTWQIEIDRLPHFCDEIRVSTWAASFKGLFASRNFMVEDVAAAQTIVRADSRWFMFDDATGRPVRAPESEVAPYADDLANDAPLPLPPMGRKIGVPDEGGVDAEPIHVTPSLIDTNHHVNNAQYVSIALSLLPRDLRVAKLDVQYIAAAKLGCAICPRVYALPSDPTGPADSASPADPGAPSVSATAETPGYLVSLNAPDATPYAVVRVR